MDSLSFFKSLADDTRLKILLLITQEQELCVCELTQALSLSQPKISRHIALLKRDGLLADRREAKWVFYRLSEQLPAWQVQTLQRCLAQQLIDVQITENETQNTLDTFSENKITSFSLVSAIDELARMGNRPKRQQQCCN